MICSVDDHNSAVQVQKKLNYIIKVVVKCMHGFYGTPTLNLEDFIKDLMLIQ